MIKIVLMRHGESRQTAEAITAATGVAARVDARLREKSFGLLGGLTFAEADERYPGLNWRSPQVQSLPRRRVVPGTVRPSLTHGGTIQALYRAALGLPVNTPHYFLNGDTCVHEWWVEPGGGSVKVLKSNCTYHLRSLSGV